MSFHAFIQKKLKYALLLKQTGDYLGAEEELQEGLEKDPHNIFLLTSLGDLYSRQNRLEEASDIADLVLLQEMDNQRALIIKGDISLKKKKYSEAADYFKNALHKGATSYINKRLIQALMKNKSYSEAIKLCREVLLKNPDNPVFMKLLARCYKNMNNYKEAEELYEKLIIKCPDDKFIYKEYIEVKAVDKSLEDFLEDLEKILKVPAFSENVHLRLLLAGKLKKAGRLKEAIKEYKICLEVWPGDLYILKQLGFSYMKIEDLNSAIKVLKPVFLRDPKDYYVKSSLMSAFRKTGEVDDFVKLIEDAIKRYPQEKTLWGFKKKVLNKLL